MLSIAMVLQSGPKDGRKLVFEQRFDRMKMDALVKEWKFDDGPVYNNELEKYTLPQDGNAKLTRDGLVIEARKENGRITSARLQSKQTWQYGYYEIVAKMPTGQGTWPAIWMLGDSLRRPTNRIGWPACGEIDIMENVGKEVDKFHYSLHCQDYNWMRPKQRTKVTTIKNAPAKFHTFGIDWKKDTITFMEDGKSVYSVTDTEHTMAAWPFNAPFYMILNLAIGGNMAGKVDDSIFPAKFIVKSVRIWQ